MVSMLILIRSPSVIVARVKPSPMGFGAPVHGAPVSRDPGNFSFPPPDHVTHSSAKGFGSLLREVEPRVPALLSVFILMNLPEHC